MLISNAFFRISVGIEELTTRIAGLDTLENKNKDSKYVCMISQNSPQYAQ